MKPVILITGASTGFGRAAAETLARRGYTVLATMRDPYRRNASHREALQSLAKREHLALHVSGPGRHRKRFRRPSRQSSP